jgi:hypothetical protein
MYAERSRIFVSDDVAGELHCIVVDREETIMFGFYFYTELIF